MTTEAELIDIALRAAASQAQARNDRYAARFFGALLDPEEEGERDSGQRAPASAVAADDAADALGADIDAWLRAQANSKGTP